MKFQLPSQLPLLSLLLLACVLLSCSNGGTAREGGFDGLGQGHVTATEGVVKGEVLFKDYSGGEIFVEARATFPCAHGRCPVIEREPLGIERLSGPGAFTLPLIDIEESVIIIATYPYPDGKVRIAHHLIENTKKFNEGVVLSLDRPYPPIR